MVMKKVSIQDLKAHLSNAIAEAEAGETIVVTRHNEPVARLVADSQPHVHRASRVSRDRLRPVLKRATRGRYLAVLRDDRADR